MSNASLKFDAQTPQENKKIGLYMTVDDEEDISSRMARGFKNELSLSNITMHKLSSGKHSIKIKAAVDKEVKYAMDPTVSSNLGFAMEAIVLPDSVKETESAHVRFSKMIQEDALDFKQQTTWGKAFKGVRMNKPPNGVA